MITQILFESLQANTHLIIVFTMCKLVHIQRKRTTLQDFYHYIEAPPLLAGLQLAQLLLASLHRTFASFIFVLTNFCFFYLCIN